MHYYFVEVVEVGQNMCVNRNNIADATRRSYLHLLLSLYRVLCFTGALVQRYE